MKIWIFLASNLFLAAALTGEGMPLTSGTQTLLATLAFLISVSCLFSLNPRIIRERYAILLLLGGVSILVFEPVIAGVIALSTVGIVASRRLGKSKLLTSWGLVAPLAFLVASAVSADSKLNLFFGKVCYGIATGRFPEVEIGFSAFGGTSNLLGLALLIIAFRHLPRRATVLSAFFLALCFLGMWAVVHPSSSEEYPHSMAWSMGHFRFYYSFIVLGIWVLSVFPLAYAGSSGKERGKTVPTPNRWAKIVTAAIGIAVAVSYKPISINESSSGRILFYEEIGGDWDKAEYGNYGVYSGGMFGQVEEYLSAAGFETERINDIESGNLGQGDVLVLINCPHVWTQNEAAMVQEFVSEGGGLLALGDHTDVFGLMRGMNGLLTQFGIEFRFDSAIPLAQNWTRGAKKGAFSPRVGGDPRSWNTAIGASLRLRPPAVPVSTGVFGFSDIGVPENHIGAYLGDYLLGPGEPCGDMNLIAWVPHRRGQVLVFGDTSGFQNSSLPYTFQDFVLPVFDLLSKRRVLTGPIGPSLLSIFGLLAIGSIIFFRGVEGYIVSFLIALTATLMGSSLYERGLEKSIFSFENSIVIEKGGFPDTGHYDAKWNSIAPLISGAARAGGLPIIDHFNKGAPPGALAIIAPSASFSDAYIENIQTYVQQGGSCLLAASGIHAASANALLKPTGISIGQRVTGQIPPNGEQVAAMPRFVSPSSIRKEGCENYNSIYAYGDKELVGTVSFGTGQFVIVADSRFFSTENIEGEWGWWGGNLRLLRDLFISLGVENNDL